MTVGELVELLRTADQDREVIMADDEGNSYSPLDGLWCGKYRAETMWSGKAGLEGLNDEYREQGYTDKDVMTDGVPALFLTPVAAGVAG